MKKIGILTFFQADNYGALLQCFALSKFCSDQNNEVSVIDYHSKKMFTWKHRVKKIFVKTIQNKKFNNNRKNYYKVGNQRDFYDMIIVGSDQVWNPEIIKGDRFWIEPKIRYDKIISYAASIGKTRLNDDEKHFLDNCNFSMYDFISVREKSGRDVLNELGIKSEVVCDPTLLFYDESHVYNEIIEHSKLSKKDYIFVYSLEKSEEIDAISYKLANLYGLKVISCHPANNKTQKCSEFIIDTDICDFLYLIKNSKIVVTNSFHGLSFSYIFRKEVYCVSHSTLSSRQTDLIMTSGINYESSQPGQYHISSYSRDEKMKSLVNQSRSILCDQIK